MLSAMRISSYGCSWEVWGALKKLGKISEKDVEKKLQVQT